MYVLFIYLHTFVPDFSVFIYILFYNNPNGSYISFNTIFLLQPKGSVCIVVLNLIFEEHYYVYCNVFCLMNLLYCILDSVIQKAKAMVDKIQTGKRVKDMLLPYSFILLTTTDFLNLLFSLLHNVAYDKKEPNLFV